MPSFQTAGYRSTVTPEGRKIVQIPVSVTDDSAATLPDVPVGMRMVANEYTIRPDGGRDYVFTFESSGSAPGDAQIQINGQAAQEPIETHPKFNGVDQGPKVSEADLAAIKTAISEGKAPTLTETGENLKAAQDLYTLMLKGVTHYYTPSGVTYSETFDEIIKPDLNELCSVNRPPPDAPSLRKDSNWLQIGLRAQKIYEPPPSTQSFWRVTREWLASGPRGWNADFKIYE